MRVPKGFLFASLALLVVAVDLSFGAQIRRTHLSMAVPDPLPADEYNITLNGTVTSNYTSDLDVNENSMDMCNCATPEMAVTLGCDPPIPVCISPTSVTTSATTSATTSTNSEPSSTPSVF